MINDHPDLDGRFMRWCEHLNVHEVYQMDNDYPTFWVCEDCGDRFPIIGDTDQWLPKLIGTRVETGEK